MPSVSEQIDTLFQEWDKPTSPGCALAIIQNGETVYQRGYGMADLEHAIPISTDSVFDIGSISKQFTALCVVLLARQGKLSLDDEIQEYIPEIRRYELPVTIRHLIHHMSGLRDYLLPMLLAGMQWENHYRDEQILSFIARQKELVFPPGEDYQYSNSGYLLLGEIVKRCSGQSLRAFAAEQIFTPLGMASTHFHDDFSEIVPNRAVGYAPGKDGTFRIDISLFDMVGDGFVYTTVEDLYRWDQNFYDNRIGGYGLDLIEQITTPRSFNSGEPWHYAFGLSVGSHRGRTTIGHGGASSGYRAQYLRFPQEKFSVICLANLGSIAPGRLVKQVADLYLDEEPRDYTAYATKAEEGAEGAQSPELNLSGFYLDHKSGIIMEVSKNDEGYTLRAPQLEVKLLPDGMGRYATKDGTLTVELESSTGQADGFTQLHLRSEGLRPRLLQKLAPLAQESVDLAKYVGTYSSEELETTWQVTVEDRQLFLKRSYAPKMPLKPTAQDRFVDEWASYEFLMDNENEVSGFTLSAYRTGKIYFSKRPS